MATPIPKETKKWICIEDNLQKTKQQQKKKEKNIKNRPLFIGKTTALEKETLNKQ